MSDKVMSEAINQKCKWRYLARGEHKPGPWHLGYLLRWIVFQGDSSMVVKPPLSAIVRHNSGHISHIALNCVELVFVEE